MRSEPGIVRRKLTRKQRKLVNARVLDPQATLEEVGIQAGYTQPRQGAYRELKKPHVQDEIRSLLNKRPKLRLGSLLEKLKEGLDATEIRSLKVEGTAFKADSEVVDHAVRHKYLETGLKLHGAFGNDRSDAPPTGPVNIAIILGGGGSEIEKSAVADALIAARIARGLHPIENRSLTEHEAEQFNQRRA